ncbi:hypothetical protein VTK56DRAFT_9026 [Thermocarpiscus australiensis]
MDCVVLFYGNRGRVLARPSTFAGLIGRACDIFGFESDTLFYLCFNYRFPTGEVVVAELDPSAYHLVTNGMPLRCVVATPSRNESHADPAQHPICTGSLMPHVHTVWPGTHICHPLGFAPPSRGTAPPNGNNVYNISSLAVEVGTPAEQRISRQTEDACCSSAGGNRKSETGFDLPTPRPSPGPGPSELHVSPNPFLNQQQPNPQRGNSENKGDSQPSGNKISKSTADQKRPFHFGAWETDEEDDQSAAESSAQWSSKNTTPPCKKRVDGRLTKWGTPVGNSSQDAATASPGPASTRGRTPVRQRPSAGDRARDSGWIPYNSSKNRVPPLRLNDDTKTGKNTSGSAGGWGCAGERSPAGDWDCDPGYWG